MFTFLNVLSGLINSSSEHLLGHFIFFSVSVTRSKEVPPFGPRILDGAMFGKTSGFVDFLLTKGMLLFALSCLSIRVVPL